MKNVFIVEDHEEIRLLYSVVINRLENVCICGEVESAEDALERIPALHPDLVLVDISLPGMDGIELVEKLKRLNQEMKFLIVSGHDPERFERSAKEAGADNIIGKGDITELASAVKSVLEI
jgi:two-component system, NarL family, response regulator EvgA